MTSHDASEMHFGDVVLAFQNIVVFYPEVGLDMQSPIGTPLGLLWRKRSTLITYCFLKAVVYPGGVIRAYRPHHKMYRRNYISITVIHPRLEAACRNQPKLSECTLYQSA
jgi:hypothetical protein